MNLATPLGLNILLKFFAMGLKRKPQTLNQKFMPMRIIVGQYIPKS